MTNDFDLSFHAHEIVRSAPLLILLLDREGRIRETNDRGLSPSLGPLAGRFLDDVAAAASRETVRDNVRKALEDCEPTSFEADYAMADGRVTLCATWLVPLREPSEEECRDCVVAAWLQDISDVGKTRWELARQKNILSAIIDSLADGIAVINARGDFLVYNRAAERLVGVNPQDVRPEDWSRHFGLYRPDMKTFYDVQELPLMRAAAGERAEDVEVYVRNPEKPSGVILSVNATPLVDEQKQHQGGVAVFRDVTLQKHNEERLRSEERLLRKLLELQESDRRLIAHEIHDGFVQDVVGANMRLEAAKARIPPELEELAQPLRQASELLRNAIKEARRMISDLRPLVMDEQGVLEAIRHLLADQQAQRGLLVDLVVDDDIPPLDSRLEGAIYRIVQEALNNVSRHAHADRATLAIRHEDGTISILVRDEGQGFDPAGVSPDRFGLRGIRERARLFGGRAVIESRPGEGTTVRAELPIRPTLETQP